MKSVVTLFLIFSLNAGAAPHPAVSGSEVVRSAYNQFFAAKGFALSFHSDQWTGLTQIHPETRIFEFVHSKYKEVKASVKITQRDPNETQVQLQKKWLQDYTQFGFEILKNHSLKDSNTFIIDLYHREKKQLIRQKIHFTNNQYATVTCHANQAHRQELQKSCP